MDSSSNFPKYTFLLNPSVGITKAVVKNKQMGTNAYTHWIYCINVAINELP